MRRFLDSGASVLATDVAEAGLQRRRAELGDSMRLRVFTCDITSERDVAGLAREAASDSQSVDILVNCAGLFPPRAFKSMTYADWRRIISVNLDSVFLMTHAMLPLLKQSGWGRVVNIGSSSFFQGTAHYVHYVAAKAGVFGFTRALAREVGQYGITANVVTPGLTSTEVVLRTAPGTILEDRRAQRAIQRFQQPQDLVGTVAFLCSPDADFVTGQTINVDGGAVMH